MVGERIVPELDGDGFMWLEDLAAKARALASSSFARVYSVPALVVSFDSIPDPSAPTPSAPTNAGEMDGLERSFKRTVDTRGSDARQARLRYGAKVAFLTKRPNNPFPWMVSIGRALNCDIALNLTSVSKIHGIFQQEPDGAWSYGDQQSSNGSFVNDQRLAPNARRVLPDGTTLRLGPDIAFEFFSPGALHARLTK